MIAIDSSAIIAILFDEPDKHSLRTIWEEAQGSLVCAATVLECYLVFTHTKVKPADLNELLEGMGVEIVAFDAALLPIAVAAHRKFGKGKHKANLNFGDCMSYALAKHRVVPLLCKGEDFKFTDVALAA